MPKLLIADLTDEKLRRGLGGPVFPWPPIMGKADLYFGLRFSRSHSVGGRIVHVVDHPIVREIRATIGQVDLQPEAGQFNLKVGTATTVLGTNLTTMLDWDATAAEIETALNVLTVVGTAVVVEDGGSFLVTGIPEAISCVANTLRPISFVRVEAYTVNDTLTHAIRIQRAPLAFADTYTQRVPSPPTITRVQAGGSDGDITWNEVQKLTVPVDFAGSYQIRSADNIQRTALLGLADTPTTVSTAINPSADGTSIGVADDSDGVFVVTQVPNEPAVRIEFTGSMAGAAHDLLLVTVFDAPEGDYWLTLPIDTAAASGIFRTEDKIKLPMEIYVDVEDPDDDEIVRTFPVFRGEVTVHESITHADLGTAANIDYLRPPAPKSYLPFNSTQVITGQRHYSTAAGNGVLTTFVIAHNLASEEIDVRVRENVSGGALLVHGTDYSVEITDDNTIEVTVLGSHASPVPGTGDLIITVADLTAAATFAEALEIELAQVNDLSAALDALSDRLTALEGQIGSSGGGTTTSAVAADAEWPLSPIMLALRPTNGVTLAPAALAGLDPAALGLRYRSLVGAVHDAALETLATTLPAPSAAYVGRVFTADADNDNFPGGGIRSGDHAICDGTRWLRAINIGGSSYYPAEMEVELFTEIVLPDDLTLGSVASLQFGFETAILYGPRRPRDRKTEASWRLIVESGIATAATTPGTPGPNISGITWTTMISSDIRLTPTPRPHRYGVEITRTTANALTARKTTGRSTTSATAPNSGTGGVAFFLRGRLTAFDTNDSAIEPAGIVLLHGLDVALDGTTDATLGRLTVG